MSHGGLFILSAPSGAGKTTLIRALMSGELGEFKDLHFSVSHTTRPPREHEIDEHDYYFVDPEHFRSMVERGEFLEWAEVHGNLYGTSVEEIKPRLESGRDVVMDIDVKGAENVLQRFREPDPPLDVLGVYSIFILPPSHAALRERLEGRGLDDQAEIERRLAVSRWELERVSGYDYAIVNDEAERASRVLASIIRDKRHRLPRMRTRIDQLLETF